MAATFSSHATVGIFTEEMDDCRGHANIETTISESESAHGDMVETTINTRRCTSTTASDVSSSTFVAS